MKKIIRLLLWMSVTITALSCNKEKDSAPTTKTKTELLTNGTWKYTGAVVSPAYDYYGDGNPVTDIFAIMKPCEKDEYEVEDAGITYMEEDTYSH